MIELFTPNQLKKAKYRDKLPLQCEFCHESFWRTKKEILYYQQGRKGSKGNFCSFACIGKNKSKNLPAITCICGHCGKEFCKSPAQFKKSKNHFCSQSCFGFYYNANHKKGITRSKLEVWLERELHQLFPNLEIIFNHREKGITELDIYIPSLCLAFELNGVVHYKPIYGEEKLQRTQLNDQRKVIACREQNISLSIIDVSWIKQLTEEGKSQILNLITSSINCHSLVQ